MNGVVHVIYKVTRPHSVHVFCCCYGIGEKPGHKVGGGVPNGEKWVPCSWIGGRGSNYAAGWGLRAWSEGLGFIISG